MSRIQLAREAEKATPSFHLAQRALGAALLRSGAARHAITLLKKAIELDGADAPELFVLAEAFAQFSRHEEAREAYKRAGEWMNQHRPNDSHLRALQSQVREKISPR